MNGFQEGRAGYSVGRSNPIPQVSAERQANALDEIAQKLDVLIGEFSSISNRMNDATLRAAGPEPEPAGQKPTAGNPNTTLALIAVRLDTLSAVAEYQRNNMIKIERII